MNARLVARTLIDFSNSKFGVVNHSHCGDHHRLLHDVADPAAAVVSPVRRSKGILGIPNFGDVISNLSFAFIGVWGLAFVLRTRCRKDAKTFVDDRERWPYLFAFVGLLLTAFGSAYYHLDPDNARLVWDRLPMAITFMSMVSAVIAERVNVRLGIWLLPILLIIGPLSVLQWYWSETRSAGTYDST